MLVLLSNPVVSVKGSSEDIAKSLAPAVLNAEVSNGKIILTLPENGQFIVRLVSTNGRTIVSARTSGAGTNSISLAKVPMGTYLLECSGPAQKLVKTVMIGK
jgi:hypothetical protein